MKTVAGGVTQSLDAEASPIVRLADAGHDADALRRARAFAEPLLTGQRLDTGEDALAHADGVAAILQGIGAAPSMRAAAYLVYAGDYLQRPEEVVSKAFGVSYAGLVSHTRKLVQIQRSARDAQVEVQRRALQTERVRKMLLAFASDLRVVLLRLASRLQTLRWYAASKHDCPRRWRANRWTCLRRWPTGWASGRSSGSWRTWHFASCSQATTTAWPR